MNSYNLALIYNEIAPYYDIFYTKNTEEIIQIIKKFCKGKKRILDLGCGNGRISIPLAKHGFNVFGLDISNKMIEEAKKRAKKVNLKIKFKVGNMRDIPFRDMFFDVVICLQSTIMNLLSKDEQIKTVNEIKRVLRDDGLLILETEDWEKIKNQLNKKMNNINVRKIKGRRNYLLEFKINNKLIEVPQHFFTYEEILKLFEKFNVVDTKRNRRMLLILKKR